MCVKTPSVTLYANNNKISYVSRDMNKETLSERVKEKQKITENMGHESRRGYTQTRKRSP